MKRSHLFDPVQITPWMQLLPLTTETVPGIIETKALVFDGVADYGYALNGAQGVGDTWSFVLKVNGRHSTSPRYFGHVYDGTTAAGGQIIDGIYASDDRVMLNGATTDGTYNGNYLVGPVGGVDRTGVQVITVIHRNIPTRRMDYFITRNGITLASGGMNLTVAQARTPLHVAVSAALNYLHVPVATTYSPQHLIASAIVNGAVTEAQSQAYSITRNAKLIWPAVFGYWNMADISAGAVPDRGTGNHPMTVVGPTSADLEVVA